MKFIYLILFLFFVYGGYSQTIPQNELDGMTWLNQQYLLGLTIDNTLCGLNTGLVSFSCIVIGPNYHFQQIYIYKGQGIDTGSPNPDFIFNFQNLTTFTINFNLGPYSKVKNPSLNILNYLKNLPLMNYLNVQLDTTAVVVPDDFPTGMPLINEIQLNMLNITYLPNQILTTTAQFLTFDAPISGWNTTIPSTVNNLKMSYGVNGSNTNSYFEMKSSEWPNLQTWKPRSAAQNITIKVSLPNLNYIAGEVSQASFVPLNALLVLDISPCNNLLTLGYTADQNHLFEIIPRDLTIFTKLRSISFFGYNQVGIPFTAFPISFTKLLLNMYTGTTFPVFPSIPSLQSLDLSSSSITSLSQGILPNMSIPSISMAYSSSLGGKIPDDFCRVGNSDFVGTIITDIPDCMKCYYSLSSFVTVFSAPASYTFNPTGFICNSSISTTRYGSLDGNTITVRGKNLGWMLDGGPSITVLIPNELFKVSLTDFSVNTIQLVFSNSANTKFNISYFDARFVSFGPSIRQYPNRQTILTLNVSPNDKSLPTSLVLQGLPACNVSIVGFVYTCILPGLPEGEKNITFSNEFNSQTFTTNFTLVYPVVSSISPILSSGGVMTLWGNFGGYLNSSTITLNNQHTCNVTNLTSTMITCNLIGPIQVGEANLTMTVDGYPFESNSLINVIPSSNVEECIKLYNNCSGNGYCDPLKGTCVCTTEGYTGVTCESKPGGGIIIINPTDPTGQIQVDGYQFNFTMVAIQELDLDENVVNQILTDKWSLNLSKIDGFEAERYDYKLNLTGRDNIPQNLTINSTIFFTNVSYEYSFGQKNLTLFPNSLKIGVNIDGWGFKSLLNHLRVVFETTINTYQVVGCQNTPLDSLVLDVNGKSIQYLRIVKGKTQFFGRFLDYSLSDGIPTYSRNELINSTVISDTESNILIGIHLPQCSTCQLDPDFTSLLEYNTNNDNCKTTASWKIIVGVVVGVVGALAITIGSILLYRKKAKIRRFNKAMVSKLAQMSQSGSNQK